jgi:hypothetical protein
MKSKSNHVPKYDLISKSNHHLESDLKSKANQNHYFCTIKLFSHFFLFGILALNKCLTTAEQKNLCHAKKYTLKNAKIVSKKDLRSSDLIFRATKNSKSQIKSQI